MEDEKITYASVTFRPTAQFNFKAETEEIVYDEVKVSHENPPGPNGELLQDEAVGIKSKLSQLLSGACGIPCGLLILVFIIGLSVYISMNSVRSTDELSQWRTNQTKLLENSQNQTRLHSALLSDFENLKNSFMDLKSKIQNISAINQQLVIQNEELKKQNVNLKLQRDNMEAEWKKLNDNRECPPYQKNWKLLKTKCYEVNQDKKVSWKEAQQDCEQKKAQLFLLDEPPNKLFSVGEFWIGLRFKDRKWKWINGSNLLESSSTKNSPGHCAVSTTDKDWKFIHCHEKNYWICEKKSLSF